MQKKKSRRQEILEALAAMLEASPGGRITTAALAVQVGVSEAALYRHFPSKAKMFEGLLEFVEDALFSRIARIRRDEQLATLECCEQVLALLLGFCERNPGITRMLTGDALTGETERLRTRVQQLFDRIETELRQILRDGELKRGERTRLPANLTANLILATAEGRISQFVRSEFKRSPTEYWNEQWSTLSANVLKSSLS